MNTKAIALYTGIIMSLTSLFSCSKEDAPIPNPDPTAGMSKLTSAFVPGTSAKLELYANATTLLSGYNSFYITLSDSATGQKIDKAEINLNPMMDMGTMKHSAPYENPASTTAVDHIFPCSVVFTMPSSGGSWTLDIAVQLAASEKKGKITIPVTVAAPVKPTLVSFLNKNDGATYFAALVQPVKPRIGINDLELAIYKKASMMSFPADSSLSVFFEPEMPTMNHGSPNNVDPKHQAKGHYKGKVNFTMTGWWRLNLRFMNGATIADSTKYFDIEF